MEHYKTVCLPQSVGELTFLHLICPTLTYIHFTATYILPTATYISFIAEMGVTYDIKIHGIDKLVEGNWVKWAWDVTFTFQEAGLVSYLDSSCEAPNDLKEKAEWLQYNSHIIRTFSCIIDNTFTQELTPDMLAVDAWALLKKRTIQTGIITKLNSMRATLTMKFSKSKKTNTTISEINDHSASIFEAGITPTQDEW